MKIRLISPESIMFFGNKTKFKQVNLTLIYLAAITPPSWTVEVIDENQTIIPFDTEVDLVGITVMSSSADRSYHIARQYKKIGVPVIMGGFHVSLFPEEALQFCDAVVVGEAEDVLENLLTDFKNNSLKKIYKSTTKHDLKDLPIPKYEFYNLSDCNNVVPVFTSRGCPYKCSFCAIAPVYGQKVRKRPIQDIVRQIEFIKRNCVAPDAIPPLSISFIDDNIWGDKKYAMQLMRALIPLKIKWASQVSITTDEEIFALAAESGCMFVFPGFESLTPDNLTFLDKPQNIVEKYPEMIEKLHKHNIGVAGFFIVGLPHDNKDVFKNLFLFSEKNNIEVILISLFQPTPGTKQYLNWEERNTYKNYQSIINDLPVFLPKGMSKKEFKKEFVDFYRLVLSDESIDKRLERCKNPGLYFWNKAMQEDYNQSLMDDWAEGKQNLSR